MTTLEGLHDELDHLLAPSEDSWDVFEDHDPWPHSLDVIPNVHDHRASRVLGAFPVTVAAGQSCAIFGTDCEEMYTQRIFGMLYV